MLLVRLTKMLAIVTMTIHICASVWYMIACPLGKCKEGSWAEVQGMWRLSLLLLLMIGIYPTIPQCNLVHDCLPNRTMQRGIMGRGSRYVKIVHIPQFNLVHDCLPIKGTLLISEMRNCGKEKGQNLMHCGKVKGHIFGPFPFPQCIILRSTIYLIGWSKKQIVVYEDNLIMKLRMLPSTWVGISWDTKKKGCYHDRSPKNCTACWHI